MTRQTGPKKINGTGGTTYRQIRCVYCPSWTYNAGRCCLKCLNEGKMPIEESKRRTIIK